MPACAILVILAELADCLGLSELADSAELVDLVDFVGLGGLAGSPYRVDVADPFTLRTLWKLADVAISRADFPDSSIGSISAAWSTWSDRRARRRGWLFCSVRRP